jgi:4'-phosphopantetheinyl transferase
VSLQYAAVPAQPWVSLEGRWLPRLPPGKRAQVERLRHASGRNASLLGIALLEQALAALGLGLDPAALEFPQRGKPRMPGGPDFSISHTDGCVAAAVADHGRLGLDLEPAGAVAAATLRRVLSAAECERLARGEFVPTDAWVMKEAVVKLAGRGIGALASVALGDGSARLGTEVFHLQRVPVGAGFVGWLATDAGSCSVHSTHAALETLAPLPPAP